MYELTATVEALTSQLYYGIVIDAGNVSDTSTVELYRYLVYMSPECIINEMIRKLGENIGDKYVNSRSLQYWKVALRTDMFYKLYTAYNTKACSSNISYLTRLKVLKYRPTVILQQATAMHRDCELDELIACGICLKIVETRAMCNNIQSSVRLCPLCGHFKPATVEFFPEHSLLEAVDVIVCNHCY